MTKSYIIWCLKQLIPLRYRAKYTELVDGEEVKKISVWWMWFGKCFRERQRKGWD